MIGPLISRPEDVAAALEADPVAFAAQADAALEGADPLTVLGWAGRAFGRDLAVTAAMGDTVLAHLASRAVPGVHVLFIDTGYHFAETIGTADAVSATYPVRMLTIRPKESVAEHEAQRGQLYRTDPDACCALRKVAPLTSALEPYDAWASGLRRDESFTRSITPVVDWDARGGKVKVNPIARWTQDKVDAYIEANNVLVNTLLMDGYGSVGCFPCTRRISDGEHSRAGRWAGRSKTECGIHLVPAT
jgi:phosphoadenosine phosphosulfate reductase